MIFAKRDRRAEGAPAKTVSYNVIIISYFGEQVKTSAQKILLKEKRSVRLISTTAGYPPVRGSVYPSEQQDQQDHRSAGRSRDQPEQKNQQAPSSLAKTSFPCAFTLSKDPIRLRKKISPAAPSRIHAAPQNKIRLIKISAVPRSHHDHLLLRALDHFAFSPLS